MGRSYGQSDDFGLIVCYAQRGFSVLYFCIYMVTIVGYRYIVDIDK